MKKSFILCLGAMLMLVFCMSSCSNSDDEKDNNMVVSPMLLLGEWSASHQSMNPDYGDTCDMWAFRESRAIPCVLSAISKSYLK